MRIDGIYQVEPYTVQPQTYYLKVDTEGNREVINVTEEPLTVKQFLKEMIKDVRPRR